MNIIKQNAVPVQSLFRSPAPDKTALSGNYIFVLSRAKDGKTCIIKRFYRLDKRSELVFCITKR